MARASTLESLRAAARSPRVGAVALQSFSSGMPLGLVWIALPAWLAYRHVDIKTIGYFSLAQAPWNFKFLWAPLMDRFSLPWLGRKRSWIVLCQLLLALGTAGLALEGSAPSVGAVAALATFIAFASASQDIAIDAYAVEILEKDEQGLAVGARIAVYRLAMYTTGALALTLGALWGWAWVFVGQALLFLPMVVVAVRSPEPERPPSPPHSLRAAVWEPLVSVFRMDRALEILAFVLLYKLGENLATALTRPFLIERGFTPADVGVATATLGLAATLIGTFAGGFLTERIGLGRCLWLSGLLQAVGCLGYAFVDRLGGPAPGGGLFDLHRLAMYGAVSAEAAFQGMAAGALGVLLLRLTSRSFSATQFALFSSIFALGRVLVGPLAGILVDALGWSTFFVFTVAASVPGLALLARFAPLGAREPILGPGEVGRKAPLGRPALAVFTALGFVLGSLFALGSVALLGAARQLRTARPPAAMAGLGSLTLARLAAFASKPGARDLAALAGPLVFGLVCALGTAALLTVRRGPRADDR